MSMSRLWSFVSDSEVSDPLSEGLLDFDGEKDGKER